MPIVVTCPGCPAKLNVPDSAAGKQIRCPKCGAVAHVPALVPSEEVPVVDAAVVSPAAKPKRVVAEVDRPRKPPVRDEERDDQSRKKKRSRDDEDADDDRPRRRKSRGGGSGKVVGLIVGGLLLLAGLGLGVYFLAKKGTSPFEKSGVFAKTTPAPVGWKQFAYPDSGLRAYFPNEPQVASATAGAGGFGGLGRGPFAGEIELRDVESVSMYTSLVPGELLIEVEVIRFRNDVPRSVRDAIAPLQSTSIGGAESRKVRWLGSDAAEVVSREIVQRTTCTGRLVVIAMIKSGSAGKRLQPEIENGFFDNVELTK